MVAMRNAILILATCLVALIGCTASQPTATSPQAVSLFNGRDLSGWVPEGRVKRNFWKVGTAAVDPANPKKLIVTPGGSDLVTAGIVGADLRTERTFGDAIIELDFMLPRDSNSGIFLMGEYELQTSHDAPGDPPDMKLGAIVRTAPPLTQVNITPGDWNHYSIEYRAPRFDAAGRKTANLRIVRITLNGGVVQRDLDVAGPTPGGLTEKEHPTGPLILQGSEGPAAFRNITVTPM